jgi:hypothetical protein
MSAAVWVMPSDGRASYQNCTHAEPLQDVIRTGELFPLLPPFPFLLPSSITSIPEAAIAPFATIAGLQRLQLLSTVGLLKNYHARNNASPPKHSASIMASAAPDYSAPAVPAAYPESYIVVFKKETAYEQCEAHLHWLNDSSTTTTTRGRCPLMKPGGVRREAYAVGIRFQLAGCDL